MKWNLVKDTMGCVQDVVHTDEAQPQTFLENRFDCYVCNISKDRREKKAFTYQLTVIHLDTPASYSSNTAVTESIHSVPSTSRS